MAAHRVSGATTGLADVDSVEMFNLIASEIIVDSHACIPILCLLLNVQNVSAMIAKQIARFFH